MKEQRIWLINFGNALSNLHILYSSSTTQMVHSPTTQPTQYQISDVSFFSVYIFKLSLFLDSLENIFMRISNNSTHKIIFNYTSKHLKLVQASNQLWTMVWHFYFHISLTISPEISNRFQPWLGLTTKLAANLRIQTSSQPGSEQRTRRVRKATRLEGRFYHDVRG